MVRKERLELSRLAALEPKSSASTNSATFAFEAGRLRGARIITERSSIRSAIYYSPSMRLARYQLLASLRQFAQRDGVCDLIQAIRPQF